MNFNGQTLILLNSIETHWNYFACEWIRLDNLDFSVTCKRSAWACKPGQAANKIIPEIRVKTSDYEI